jgi:hypothetical protein
MKSMNLDQELKSALGRTATPPGFTERAIARVRLAAARRWSMRGVMRIAAAAALVTIVGLGAYQYNANQRRNEGELAKQQLLLALQITADKAEIARRAIYEVEQP